MPCGRSSIVAVAFALKGVVDSRVEVALGLLLALVDDLDTAAVSCSFSEIFSIINVVSVSAVDALLTVVLRCTSLLLFAGVC